MVDPLLRYGSPVQVEPGGYVRFYWSKWVTFSCAAVLMVSAGLPYAFSIYGSALQKALYLSNSRLSTLGAFSNAGGYLAVFSGMAYDYLKKWKRAGPFLCVLVGCSCYAVGFYGLYVIGISRDTSESRFWTLCILSFISSNGGTWLEAAALSTTLRNFETHRGPVVGILKAFLGLSASIYTTLYVTFCKHRLDVLWLLAVVPSSVGAVAAVGVNLVPFRQTERASKEHAFHMAIYATLSMAIYQLVTALYFSTYSTGHPLKDTPSGVGLLMCCAVLLLMVPIVSLPLVFGGVRAQPIAQEIQSAAWALPAGDVTCQGEEVPQEPCLVRLNLPAPRLPDNVSDTDEGFLITSKAESTLLECLQTLDYWLLCGSISITSGAGLAFINNASSITRSLHGTPNLTVRSHQEQAALSQSVIVSNFSVFNCIGRMSTTFLPDRVWRKQVARTDFLVLGHLLSAGCSMLAAHSTTASLPLVAVITGRLISDGRLKSTGKYREIAHQFRRKTSIFSISGIFGFMQGLAPTIVSELFGLTNFASNYALLTTMFIFSSFSIANGLMSWNYDLFSNHHHPSQCHGSRCHKLGFYICAGLCTFACVLSIILTIRRKEFYHMMHKAVRREKRRRGADALHIHRDKIFKLLLSRIEHALSLSKQQMRDNEDRKERLMNLMNTGQRRMKPEQVQLIQTWQEEFALLEQGLEKVDSVLHGYTEDLQEDIVMQSFISEPSSSTFHLL